MTYFVRVGEGEWRDVEAEDVWGAVCLAHARTGRVPDAVAREQGDRWLMWLRNGRVADALPAESGWAVFAVDVNPDEATEWAPSTETDDASLEGIFQVARG